MISSVMSALVSTEFSSKKIIGTEDVNPAYDPPTIHEKIKTGGDSSAIKQRRRQADSKDNVQTSDGTKDLKETTSSRESDVLEKQKERGIRTGDATFQMLIDDDDENETEFREEVLRWSRGFPQDIKDQLIDILTGESGTLAEDESELIEYLMIEGSRRRKLLRPSDYVPPPDPNMRTLVYPDDMKFRAKYLDENTTEELHKLRQSHQNTC